MSRNNNCYLIAFPYVEMHFSVEDCVQYPYMQNSNFISHNSDNKDIKITHEYKHLEIAVNILCSVTCTNFSYLFTHLNNFVNNLIYCLI
jgi:hypothetical protein